MDEYCLKVNKQSTMEDEKSKDVSNELSLVKMDTREDNKTTYQSPFRKKDQESPESE